MEPLAFLWQMVEELLEEYEDYHAHEDHVFAPLTEFGAFLTQLGIPAGVIPPEELPIRAAFALVRWASIHPPQGVPPAPLDWPPPAELINRAQAQWEYPGHQQTGQPENPSPERAPEFVVAFLLGWHRQPVPVGGPNIPPPEQLTCPWLNCPDPYPISIDPVAPENGWEGVVQGTLNFLCYQAQVAYLAQLYFHRLTHIPGLVPLHTQPWLFNALRRFCWVNNQSGVGCNCPRKCLDGDPNSPESLTQAGHCSSRHSVRFWRPSQLSFWTFARRAILGFEEHPESLAAHPNPADSLLPGRLPDHLQWSDRRTDRDGNCDLPSLHRWKTVVFRGLALPTRATGWLRLAEGGVRGT
jgi:hypothetical protein